MNAIVRSARCMGWKTGLLTAACCVLGGTVGTVASMMQPAISLSNLHEMDGIAVEGGTLDIIVDATRNKACPVDIDRWLERPDPLKPDRIQYVWLGVPRVPPIAPGRASYRITIALPPNIQPGRWFYHAQARNDCGILPMWLSAAQRDTGRVPVDVQAPSPGSAPQVITPPTVKLLPGTSR